MEFRRLLPDAATVQVGELLASLQLADRASAERPYTVANFVTTVDGRTTLGGRSGAIGDDGDSAIFHGLRELVDAVLVGTRTLRAEQYGRIMRDAERRQRRAARGLRPEPLACVVTRSGELPTDIPLFAESDANIVVFSASDVDLADCAAQVDVFRLDTSESILTAAVRRLRSDYGVGTLLCEGGPTIFAALLREGLLDELFLTVAPKLAGGGHGPTISTGRELEDPQEMQLKWALERSGSLYLRYALR